jgi:hypothetical protein
MNETCGGDSDEECYSSSSVPWREKGFGANAPGPKDSPDAWKMRLKDIDGGKQKPVKVKTSLPCEFYPLD